MKEVPQINRTDGEKSMGCGQTSRNVRERR